MTIVLPALITLNEHGGDFTAYEEAIHEVYLDIFRNPPILFKNKLIIPIVQPIQHNGRHFTFSHITSTGKVEDDRELDLRRCERIAWIKVILEQLDHPSLKIWRQPSNRRRIAIWSEGSDFLIVLQEGGSKFKLITAFPTGSGKYKTRYNKEYADYLSDLAKGKVDPI